MVFKRYSHSTASRKSVLGPYSGLKVPKRKIVKNRSYYITSEDNDGLPYAYVESSNEMDDEPQPMPVSKKHGKKRAATAKRNPPVKKRRYNEHEDDYSDNKDDDHDDDDGSSVDEQEADEVVRNIKSKKKHVQRKVKRQEKEIKKSSEIEDEGDGDGDDDDDDDEHHGRGLEFIKPRKMSVSMKLKQEEQKAQKTEESEDENPEIIVKKLNNLGSVINDKQTASVLDLKNTDISLLSSTLKGVIDAQLPEVPGLDKEELKKFCKSRTTLKEKKRMLMNSQFLTPVGKYLSLLEIDN